MDNIATVTGKNNKMDAKSHKSEGRKKEGKKRNIKSSKSF